MFSIESIQELIDKNKSKLIKELDMKTLDNDKLSKEGESLLQVLDYSPKKLYSEKEIMYSLPVIKLKQLNPEKKQPKKNKHMKLVSTPNIDMDSIGKKSSNNLRASLFANNLENSEKKSDVINKEEKEEKIEDKKEEKKEENNDDEDDEEFERKFALRQRQMEEREKKKYNFDDDDDSIKYTRHKTDKVIKKKS